MPSERDYLSDDQLKSSNGEIEVCGLFIYNFIHVLWIEVCGLFIYNFIHVLWIQIQELF